MMTPRRAALLGLAFFLAAPLPCAAGMAFMGRRTEHLYWMLNGLGAALLLFGLAAITAAPAPSRGGFAGPLGVVVGGLVGCWVGFNSGGGDPLSIGIGAVGGLAAGSLLLFRDWLCGALERGAQPPPG